jgi:hypothetical protein
MDRIFLRVADWEHGCALMSTRPSHSSAPGGCSKFIRCSACAVQINRHNLDLLCDDDCGGVGPVGHDASQPTRVVAGPGPSLLSTAGRGARPMRAFPIPVNCVWRCCRSVRPLGRVGQKVNISLSQNVLGAFYCSQQSFASSKVEASFRQDRTSFR